MVSLMRAWTAGNSLTAMRNNLHKLHSEEWLKKQLMYLTECQRHKRGMTVLGQVEVNYKEAIPFPPFPTYKWLLTVYIMDVWLRRSTLLA